MLVAGGRTKEVSWREVSRVKKELENMPPPTPVNYWQGKGKDGVTELTSSRSLTPAPHLGLAFATGSHLCPSTWETGRGPRLSLGGWDRRQGVVLTTCALALCLLPPQFKLPKEYSWPEKKLKVSILPDVVFDSPLH